MRLRQFPLIKALAGVMLLASQVGAIDTVTRKSADKPAAGQITSVSKTQVVVTPRVGDAVTVPANDIADVDWEVAPPDVKLGRSQESSGQFDLAVKSYQKAATEFQAANANVRAEIEFLIARATARLAFGDPAQLGDAAARLKSFAEKNRDHYRYFEARQFLGDVALAQADTPAAEAAFEELLRSPWTDYQMAGNIGKGRILFARDDLAGAKQAFDAVAAAAPKTPAETSRRLEALLGQAKCLQRQSQFAEAVQILDEVIRESAAGDARLQAEAYLRQGDAYASLGDETMPAIMAYLHVDVVPALAQQADFHAEALYHLAQLWPTVGHQDRGAQASARLVDLYPNSEWTKKLTGTD